MSDPALKPWTVEEFFRWQERQPDRYELVGGFPLRMMAGARNVHDDIVVNIVVDLGRQLRGSGGRPFTGDGSIETFPGQIRRPDVGVDCGARDPNGFKAAIPRVVIEVLSPSTRDFNTFGKLAEYEQLNSLEYILLIEPNLPEVLFLQREIDRTWNRKTLSGLDQNVEMPFVGVTVALASIYDGVQFLESHNQ
jgi:Uma2 family endonuclease